MASTLLSAALFVSGPGVIWVPIIKSQWWLSQKEFMSYDYWNHKGNLSASRSGKKWQNILLLNTNKVRKTMVMLTYILIWLRKKRLYNREPNKRRTTEVHNNENHHGGYFEMPHFELFVPVSMYCLSSTWHAFVTFGWRIYIYIARSLFSCEFFHSSKRRRKISLMHN